MNYLLLSIFLSLLTATNCQKRLGLRRRAQPPRGNGPRPLRANGAQRPSPELGFITNAEKACLQKCDLKQRRLGCPVIPRFLPSLASCRACLGWECPPEPFVSGFVTERCEVSSYAKCRLRKKCPNNYRQSYQNAFAKCARCRDKCLSEDRKKEIVKKMKTTSTCLAQCAKKDNRCSALSTLPSCRNCAKKQCQSAGTRTLNCLMRNMQNSKRCPTCSNIANRPGPLRPGCACAKSCIADSTAPKRDGASHWAYLQFLPVNSIKCLSSRCSGVCPNAESRQARLKAIPQTCRKCIESRCPRSSVTPGFDDQTCRSKAYHTTCGWANGCPLLTAQLKAQDAACLNCYDGCISAGVKKDVREKMAASDSMDRKRASTGALRPQTGGGTNRRQGPSNINMNGPRNLFKNNDNDFLPESSMKCLTTNCQSKCKPKDLRADPDDVDGPCRLCIRSLCRKTGYTTSFDNMKCRNDAHSSCGPFFGCEVLDPKTVTERFQCQSCVDNCIPENVKVQARTKSKKFTSCMETCKKSYCGHLEKCRQCVDQSCSGSSVKNCRQKARNSCLPCKLTKTQEDRCNSCDKVCRTFVLTSQNTNKGGTFVRPVSCAESCRNQRCPSKSSVDSCEKCLSAACTQPHQVLQCRSLVMSPSIGICSCPGVSSLGELQRCKSCYSCA